MVAQRPDEVVVWDKMRPSETDAPGLKGIEETPEIDVTVERSTCGSRLGPEFERPHMPGSLGRPIEGIPLVVFVDVVIEALDELDNVPCRSLVPLGHGSDQTKGSIAERRRELASNSQSM